MTASWPDIPYEPRRQTRSALHLYTQIVGRNRLARTPWANHSWHATLYVNSRGLTTSLASERQGGAKIVLDLIDHAVIGACTNGRTVRSDLKPLWVAAFHERFLDLLREFRTTTAFHGIPNEVPRPIPFARDQAERSYDAEAVTRFFHACVCVDRVPTRFRMSFLGKVSPVHLFWDSFDMAVTRFSERPAPLHSRGGPACRTPSPARPIATTLSAGFWSGGGGVDHPAFYAYPAPPDFANTTVKPRAARFDATLGGFVLPLRRGPPRRRPDAALVAFIESTYRTAAELRQWDRRRLDCATGPPRRPRPL